MKRALLIILLISSVIVGDAFAQSRARLRNSPKYRSTNKSSDIYGVKVRNSYGTRDSGSLDSREALVSRMRAEQQAQMAEYQAMVKGGGVNTIETPGKKKYRPMTREEREAHRQEVLEQKEQRRLEREARLAEKREAQERARLERIAKKEEMKRSKTEGRRKGKKNRDEVEEKEPTVEKTAEKPETEEKKP